MSARQFGLGPAQIEVLKIVEAAGTAGVIRDDVSAALGMHPDNAGRGLKRLAELGVLERALEGLTYRYWTRGVRSTESGPATLSAEKIEQVRVMVGTIETELQKIRYVLSSAGKATPPTDTPDRLTQSKRPG